MFEHYLMAQVPWTVRLNQSTGKIPHVSKNRLICDSHIDGNFDLSFLKSSTVQSMWSLSNARPIRANQIAAGGRERVSSIVGNDCLI